MCTHLQKGHLSLPPTTESSGNSEEEWTGKTEYGEKYCVMFLFVCNMADREIPRSSVSWMCTRSSQRKLI